MLNKYINFVNIFNKVTENVLLLYKRDLNYIIELILGKSSSFKLLYNLLKHELDIFKEYINKNLKLNYINAFKLSAGVSILFIKKWNKTLYLYINYKGFNIVLIKNKYFILLISEILNKL